MKPLQEYLQDTQDFYSFVIDFTIRRHRDMPDLSYRHILEKETIFRWTLRTSKMDLFENPPVMTPFLDAAEKSTDDTQFRTNMEALRDTLTEYITEIYPGIPPEHPMYAPGHCLRFEQGTTEEYPSNICIFHLFNGISPKSFLADEAYFLGELERIMTAAEKLGCDTLYTSTWLNSNPRFLQLMPQEWNDNLSDPSYNLANHLGVNGQFIMADGGLNKKTAAYFLENGRIKYPPRRSRCSFENLRKHIDERRNILEK